MKNINGRMLLLSILVVAMFIGAAISITYRNIWIILLFILLGFAVMGYGLSLKKKERSDV
uniref:Hypopthetical protein n=1 Tax=uncultured bacterium pBIO2160 TaxID=1478047 RepID=A0A075FBN2_9BACT|nr:hypopthetical protein [uncultured bacterium pBIO2160]